MWLKLLLLTLYLLFLFILTRILEVATWYQDSGTFITSLAVLDPISLSVKKLKQILDNRGVSYSGVVEKSELVELVGASGKPTDENLADDISSTKTSTETTHFTCGSHFYEEVEDTKDSAWLVQVIMGDEDSSSISKSSWNEIISQVSNFGVRTGVFKCSLDKRLCIRKGWTSPRLILALPRGQKAKEDVILHSYAQSTTASSVLQWVRKHLSSRVTDINSSKELEEWLQFDGRMKKSEVKVIFFSILKSCPMFLSSLAIKFNGRVKFGTVDTSEDSSYKKVFNSSQLPEYLIVTPEKFFFYGSRRGECFNFKCMELFLRTFVPEINDVFLWSLLFVNALASFELFFMYSQVWKHFVLYVICVIKYNCTLFFLWLLILALYRFPFMEICTDALLKCLRIISGSYVASAIRSDFKNFYSHTYLLFTFVIFASTAGYILRKIKWVQDEDHSIFSNWWFLSSDSFVTTYFFRPMATLTRPVTSPELDLEEGMELLIERLAVPNFWLQPVISMDYIKDLPVWKYQGWCEADDVIEESKGDISCSSDEESANRTAFKHVETIVPNTQTFDNQYSSEDSVSYNINNASSQEKISKCCHKSDSVVQCSSSTSTLYPPPQFLSSEITEKKAFEVPDADRAPKGMLEFRECSICLESYRYAEFLCGLPCGHNFHMNCIMAWLSRDNHCCPICRWPSYKPKNCVPHLHFQ